MQRREERSSYSDSVPICCIPSVCFHINTNESGGISLPVIVQSGQVAYVTRMVGCHLSVIRTDRAVIII